MPVKYEELKELFIAACDLDPASRREFLDSRCGRDTDLRRELDRLLSKDSSSGVLADDRVAINLASDPPREGSAAGSASNPPDFSKAPLPQRIGHYRPQRILGAGGMGVVYLATQDNPRRDVAVKVIRGARLSRHARQRFELEAAVLARLQHPGIARIHEAGIADDDDHAERPYFAMEYVEGLTLDRFLAQHAPSLSQKLSIFRAICEAVAHAHQKGVVHRDLKPDNIIIDAASQPRILDFGVARATDADLQISTIETGAGQLLGTIPYMSPEQVQGDSQHVDMRCDIYALGVILYQMLAGRLPFDLKGQSIVSASRMIVETDPPRLASIDHSLRGDLDVITAKAMAKRPDDRYASALDLAADIRRHELHEPILAQPASAFEHLRKFARRNRGLAAGIAIAAVALVAGAVVAAVFAVGQTRALQESQRQGAIAGAASDFLNHDLIEQIDPDSASDRDITLAAALDRGAERLEGRFADAPLVEASLRLTIGQAFRKLDRLDEAEHHLDRALQIYAASPQHEADALLCRMELTSVLMARGKHAEAEAALGELHADQLAALGPEHVQTVASTAMLGASLLQQSRFADAEPVLNEALRRTRAISPDDQPRIATIMNNLATLYVYTARHEQAVAMFREALEMHRAAGTMQRPQALQAMSNLGGALANLRRFDEAVLALEEALPMHQQALGEEHRSTLFVSSTLATVYGMAGRHDDRRTLLTQTLELQRRVLGEDHLDTLVTRMNLAKGIYDRQQYELAAEEYAIVADRMAELHPKHFMCGVSRTMHGRCLMELERYEEAFAAFESAYERFVAAFSATDRHAREVASAMADLHNRWNKPEEAEAWSARAQVNP